MPDARRYRVLQITSTAAIGGAEQVALELARGCDPDRFEMRVSSLGGPPLLTEACRRAAPPIPAWLGMSPRGVWTASPGSCASSTGSVLILCTPTDCAPISPRACSAH